MNKFLLLLYVLCFCLLSCKNKTVTHDQAKPTEKNLTLADNSQTSLDWNGTYKGVLPCADCNGIETTIHLNSNLSYTLTEKYLEKSDKIFKSKGRFEWNDKGSKISLIDDKSKKFQVGENKLFKLDQNGERIYGKLEENYILKKLPQEK